MARLSDKIGRKPVMWTGCGLLIVAAIPAFSLMRLGGSYPLVFAGVLLVGIVLLCFSSTEPSTLPALSERYSTKSPRGPRSRKDPVMAECAVCGNDYEDAFVVTTVDGGQNILDSFECAAHALAPRCEHCGCMIIGHGARAGSATYCCAHCARVSDDAAISDRV